jgi:hypothetical protein
MSNLYRNPGWRQSATDRWNGAKLSRQSIRQYASILSKIGGCAEMTKLRSALAVAAFAIAASSIGSVAAADDGVSDFVNTYQCSLGGLITKIIAHHSKPGEKGRFVVISSPGPGANYVQCIFDSANRDGLCEAASGWWNNPAVKPHFSPAQLTALARLGFSTDGGHGNFRQQMQFPPAGPDPDAVAGLMLRALSEGYGARKDMQIEVAAPFALRHGFLPQKRCALIS